MNDGEKAVIDEVAAERRYQDQIWGEQNHAPAIWMAILGEEVGEANKAALEAWVVSTVGDTRDKWLVWLRRLRQELIQVAAVAVAAVESLDRNELIGNRPLDQQPPDYSRPVAGSDGGGEHVY